MPILTRRRVVALLCLLPLAAAAQVRRPPAPRPSGPSVVVRPYVLFSAQRFTAAQTFDAAFGSPIGAFVAGTLASVLGLKMAMILPALTMLLLIASVLVFSRIWTMRTVETPA